MSNNQPPIPPKEICVNCQKLFSKGQEYWELTRKGQFCMNSCVPCWEEFDTKKKVWEK